MTADDKDKRCRDAEAALNTGRPAHAAALYDALAKDYPDDDSLLMSLAWAFRDAGWRERGFEVLSTLLESELKRDIFTGFAFDEMVRILHQEGRTDQLVDLCERVLSVYPDDPSLKRTLGEAYLIQGNGVGAAAVFREMARDDGDNASLHCRLGQALIMTDEDEAAVRSFETALAADPDRSGSVFAAWVDALTRCHRTAAAKDVVKRALDTGRDTALWLAELGDLYFREHAVDDAIEAYERAIACDPSSRGAYYYRLTRLLLDAGDTKRALAFGKRASNAEPENVFYQEILNLCLREKGVES